MLKVIDLRCEYKVNPIGIGVKHPRISWKLAADGRGVKQTGYQIVVAKDDAFQDVLWDSGQVQSEDSIHIALNEVPYETRTRYYYRVKVWDNRDRSSDWSEVAFWETGLGLDEWTAEWISAPLDLTDNPEQCPMLRRSFTARGKVKSARIYATSLGLYCLELNGKRVGDEYFTPGWTSYHNRLQYQTYDVTSLVRESGNAIGAMLGPGWYKGNLGWQGQREIYGDRTALLLQLHLEYESGEQEVIRTDGEWKAAPSPILMSEIYHGETYDARLEQAGWSEPDFADSAWRPVQVIDHTKDILIAQENVPVRIVNELVPIKKWITPKGELVLDMGQNMVGWVRFQVQGEAGQEVVLQHAEILDRDGNFYTGNLRTAKQTIRYILKGGGVETFEPHFTFQGFRYLKLTGIDEQDVQLEHFKGMVLHSDMERTGSFECSDSDINQLQHNIEWGLKGNFLDVPTDCPQRDERLGWTGDAQMFIRTSTFLYNVAPFFTKWLRDLAAEQLDNGGVPFVIPDILGQDMDSTEQEQGHSSAAWGDAATINPWTLYLVYGDKRLLEEQYDSMKAWVEYIRSQGEHEYLWNTGFHFGDWVALDAKEDSYIGATDRDYIATAFYAYSTELLQKAAEVLGKEEDAKKYAELHRNIVHAFRNEFVTPAGRIAVGTQTAQILALMFNLVDGEARTRAVQKLHELLKETDYHLTTGFVGTPYLNLVLSQHGLNDVAYKLLFQKDYPSWLYQITKGATTIWEHWDGIKEDGSFWSDDMNSFNHYAYGSIGDWLYRVVAGIDLDEAEPAYKRIVIRPQPGDGLEWVNAELDSMYGKIRSAWKKDGDKLTLDVVIPANTTAKIWLPGSDADVTVSESGTALSEAEGIEDVQASEQGMVVTVGSGTYSFVIE